MERQNFEVLVTECKHSLVQSVPIVDMITRVGAGPLLFPPWPGTGGGEHWSSPATTLQTYGGTGGDNMAHHSGLILVILLQLFSALD